MNELTFTSGLLSPSEETIYRFILRNYRETRNMSIRELAEASSSSTSSIMRMVRKFGYPGYADFQSSLLRKETCGSVFFEDERQLGLNTFFEITAQETSYNWSVRRAASIIVSCNEVLFAGDTYGKCACTAGITLFESTGRKADLLENAEITSRQRGTCAVLIVGSSSECEASSIAASMPVGLVPVIMIYCGGFKPRFPCDEVICRYADQADERASSLIPAIHTLEVIRKRTESFA